MCSELLRNHSSQHTGQREVEVVSHVFHSSRNTELGCGHRHWARSVYWVVGRKLENSFRALKVKVTTARLRSQNGHRTL